MTYAEFAEELRISTRQLETWSQGVHAPDMRTLGWIGRHLGWDGVERDWTVTFVQQRIVRGVRSSGEAVRAAWTEIDAESPHLRKTAVVSVDPVGVEARRRLR